MARQQARQQLAHTGQAAPAAQAREENSFDPSSDTATRGIGEWMSLALQASVSNNRLLQSFESSF